MGIRSSGTQVADAIILGKPGKLCGLTVIVGGTDIPQVIIYDNASAASGTVLATVITPNAEGTKHVNFNEIAASNGLYADLTGASSSYIVYYKPAPSNI